MSAKLTPEYMAMDPLQKWDTLLLHGILGTDEPWIEDMRASLRKLITSADHAERALVTIAAHPRGGEVRTGTLLAERDDMIGEARAALFAIYGPGWRSKVFP